jgi:Xaa-Pro aminopeptidase
MVSSLISTLEAGGKQFAPILQNLVDKIWDKRPAPLQTPVFVHPLDKSGRTHQEKLKEIRAELVKEGADALVVAALDEIACEFNLC